MSRIRAHQGAIIADRRYFSKFLRLSYSTHRTCCSCYIYLKQSYSLPSPFPSFFSDLASVCTNVFLERAYICGIFIVRYFTYVTSLQTTSMVDNSSPNVHNLTCVSDYTLWCRNDVMRLAQVKFTRYCGRCFRRPQKAISGKTYVGL